VLVHCDSTVHGRVGVNGLQMGGLWRKLLKSLIENFVQFDVIHYTAPFVALRRHFAQTASEPLCSSLGL